MEMNIDYEKYDSMTIEELEEEREELTCAMSNERLWQKGCDDPDQVWMHEYNIAQLDQKLSYVKRRIMIRRERG